MQELISDCGHYVIIRSGVVECLVKRVSIASRSSWKRSPDVIAPARRVAITQVNHRGYARGRDGFVIRG
jgi:hypothetical protein